MPLLTNYGPVYDAVLSVLIAGVYFSGLLSSVLAANMGAQVLTPVLMAMGFYFLRAGLADPRSQRRRDASPGETSRR